MPKIAAFDDVRANRILRQTPTGTRWQTNIIDVEENNPATPRAFLIEGAPGCEIRTHFHENDQYQVIVSGDGLLGKHPLQVNAVHFARRHTPYGPLVFGEKMSYLTLRMHKDPGAQYLDTPEKQAKLKSLENRKPWQATELPKFEPATPDAALHAFTNIKDEEGLASFSISVAPNAKALTPNPAHSDGQSLVIIRGSLHYEGNEYKALSVAFVKPQEGPFELRAGAEGLDVLVLHFPCTNVQTAAAMPQALKNAPGTRVWQCLLCAFVYDEAKGLPDEGIAPGTSWEDVPETWTCPDCSASKSDFQMALVN
jgi:rubredoxin